MKKLVFGLLLLLNIMAALAALFTAYAGHLDPSSHARLSTVSIVFPYTVLPVVAFLLIWLLLRRRNMLISALTLVALLPALRTTIPVNIKSTPPDDAIKVLTYNVWLFDKWDYPRSVDNAIVRYICESDADIVCLQEAFFEDHDSVLLMRPLTEYYPYWHIQRENQGEVQMMLLSKYPILYSEPIDYESQANISMAYELKIDSDTVLVVNNHFETNAIKKEDCERMRVIKGNGEQPVENVKRDLSGESRGRNAILLHRKLAGAARTRAPQARAVARYIKEKGHKYVIVCGDFNDHPLSYTYHTVAKGLTDCFVTTGNGMGHTYQRNEINVRIDHILCSKSFRPYSCTVDTSIDDSDHYPMFCYLKRR